MLRVAYISNNTDQPKKRERKPTEKELLHREVIAIKAKDRIMARDKAKKMFAKEIADIERLERELGIRKC